MQFLLSKPRKQIFKNTLYLGLRLQKWLEKNWELTRLIPILSAMPTRIESSLIIGPWQACDSSLPLDLSSAVGISVEFQSLSWLQFYFWSTPHQASDSHRVDFDVRSLLAERKWREQWPPTAFGGAKRRWAGRTCVSALTHLPSVIRQPLDIIQVL